MENDCSFLDYSFINFVNSESLLTTSQYAKVIFHNIQEKYSAKHDLICQYSLTDQFISNSGDRIVLFKLGWQQVTDYVLFEWVTNPQENSQLQVKFQAINLPCDTNEFYQLCYISGENTVCGASIPFQFSIGDENIVTSTDSECFVQLDSSNAVESTNGVSSHLDSSEANTTVKPTNTSNTLENEVEQLKDDNIQIKKTLENTNESVEHCDAEITNLKQEVECLKKMLQVTENDVNDLKIRMGLASEEYEKLQIEKVRIEKKYEKLVKKCQGKTRNKSFESSSDMGDFLGELEPLPPFPLLL